MQTTGHIIVGDRVIKVLARPDFRSKLVSFKLRKSGRPGPRFSDEEEWFKGEPEALAELLAGKVVKM